MDPNANLEEQIQIASDILSGNEDEQDAERLAELVIALDEWISMGGFLPNIWKET